MSSRKEMATQWFLATLVVMCAASLVLGLFVLTWPAQPQSAPSQCAELMRMHNDKPPAHVVIKCKGLL
jgi:hypothetical protein